MCEIEMLNYNEQKVRTTQIEGKRWWSLCDVGRIIGFEKFYNFSNTLTDDEKKMIAVRHENGMGGRKMIFVSEQVLGEVLNRYYRPEAVEFQKWLKSEFGIDFCKAQTPLSTKKLSIAASLQKAQMLIRIAENKAIPHSKQLEIFDMALKELTGVGLNIDELLKARIPIGEVEKSVDNEDKKDEINIMDLPEVVSFIHEKETRNINGRRINFYPAEIMAVKWRKADKNDTFSSNDFNGLANVYGYKTEQYGFWKRVMTPQGEAREFMYIEGTMMDYLTKKYDKTA